MENCCICGNVISDQDSSTLTQKGCNTLNSIDASINALPGLKIHKRCRIELIRPPKAEPPSQASHAQRSLQLRSSNKSVFNSQEHCIFCGKEAVTYDKIGKRKLSDEIFCVRTYEFQDTLTSICKQRNDEWSQTVFGRIQYLQDLHAADVVYHQSCSSNFRTTKSIPKQYSTDYHKNEPKEKKQRGGRPVNTIKEEAFAKVVNYLVENEDEQLTISDLSNKMAEFLERPEEAYSQIYMKKKLEDHFGQRIVISSSKQMPNVVTFHNTVKSIIQEFYDQPKDADDEQEKERIIKAAAKLIKTEIKNMDVPNNHYPTTDQFSSVQAAVSFVPELLQTFLKDLITAKDIQLKLASLGQALIQAARPRSILAPLQLGLAVQLHHLFA